MKDSSDEFKISRLKKAALSIIFSVIIFSVFLLSLEIILRTTHLFGARLSWVIPDPQIGYRYMPGREFWHFKENDHPITEKFNNYGWRDDDWSIKKPENTYRIAVLGDSIVEALQVESDRTFLSLTEQQLNQKYGMKVDLMNFARSGFTQTEELLILKNDVEKFLPDMVILFFTPSNDIRDVSRETATDNNRPFYTMTGNGDLHLDKDFANTSSYKIASFLSKFKRHSALINLIAERYSAFRQQAKYRKKTNPRPFNIYNENNLMTSYKDGDYFNLCTNEPNKFSKNNYNINKLLIKEISDFCKVRNIRFLLVSSNIPEYFQPSKPTNQTFNPLFFENDLRDYANSLDIEYIGLQQVFMMHYDTNRQYLDWLGGKGHGRGHWNYLGHQVVADVLTSKLEDLLYKETIK